MRRMKYRLFLAGGVVAVAAALPIAQAKLDPSINDKIRKEEASHSQIMRSMHFLTDVYGPRLTGSPNHKAAAEWAAKQMTEWGFVNAHLAPWEFGHPGWANELVEAHIVSPMKAALVVQPLAWTPGTKGAVTAKAFHLIPPQGPEVPQADAARGGGRGPQRQGPTQAELTAYLDGIKDKVAGGAVLVGKPAVVAVNFSAEATRLTDLEATCRFNPEYAGKSECEGG